MKRIIFLVAMMFFLIPNHVNAVTIIPMGLFCCTYYCPCYKCSEGWGRKTATKGVYCQSEHTVAVDPSVINLGDKLLIDGETYYAEDTGADIKGEKIDIFVDTHDETIEGGVCYKDVKIVRKCKK